MRRTKRRDTKCEIALRKELYRLGLRYRVDLRVVPGVLQRADICFRKLKVAIFVDGCFWHRCPIHGTMPKSNELWWREKLQANVDRDERSRKLLQAAGWSVIRIWEHEDAIDAAVRIVAILASREIA